MTIVGFVRHGITAWNKEGREQGSRDIPLDEEGMEMAARLAQRLASEQWDVMYTSPLSRAQKTAEIIAESKQGIALVVDERLREPSGGLMEGTTEAERIDKWGIAWRELELGCESFADSRSRGIAFIEEMMETYPDQRILVVSHGGLIGQLLEMLVPAENLEGDLANTSVTIIDLQESGNSCRLFNCTKHLL